MHRTRPEARTLHAASLLAASLFITLAPAELWSAAPPPSGARQVPAVIIARPTDVSAEKNAKNRWFAPLSEAVVHFKLDALPGIRVAPLSLVIKNLPAYSDFDQDLSDEEYRKLAGQMRATHVIAPKYEIVDGGKTVQFYAEVISTQENKSIGAVERSFAVGSAGEGLDSCVIGLTKVFGVPIPGDLTRLLSFSVLSSDPKSLRELGDIIILNYYTAGDKTLQAAQMLEGLINRDAHMELAYFMCGRAYAAGGRYKKAAELYRGFFEILPEYAPLYLDYVKSLRMAKEYNEALRIVNIGEGKLRGYLPLLVEKAEVLEAAGQKAAAENAFAQVIQIDPDYPDALLFLARTNTERGKGQEALALIDRVLKKNPSDCYALTLKGRALRSGQRNDEAIAVMLQSASCNPKDAGPLLDLGSLYLQAKEYAQAAERFGQAMQLLPNEYDVHGQAARAYRLAGNPRKALEILKSIEGRFSTNTVLQKELGLLELALGDTVSARRHLESCFGEQKNDARVPMGLGDIYTGAGQYDEAFKMYNTALPISEDKNSCRLALGRLYLLKKAPGQAETYLNEVAGSDPKYRSVNRLLGDARFMSADRPGALKHYLRERELYGDDVYQQKQITTIYFESENWQQSEVELSRLLRLVPDDARGNYRLAVTYLRLKNREKGRDYLATAEKLGKPDQEILFQLGRGFTAAGLPEKAVEAYRGCLAGSPKRDKAWLELADVLLALKRDREAADAWVQVYALNRDAYKGQFASAGHLYYKLGLKTDAKRVYTQFLDNKHADAEVRANLAQVEYGDGKHARVIALLEGIGGAWASHEPTLMILAESYFATSAYAKSVAVLGKVTAANPSQQRALELLALSQEKLGSLDQACEYYERFLALPAGARNRDYAFHLGELYEKQTYRDKAVARYRRNIELYADDLRSYDRLASMYFASERWRDVEGVLAAAVKLSNAPAKFQLMMARSLTGQGRNDDAVSWYQQYLTMAPADSSAWRELGAILYARRDFSKAIAPLQMAIKYMPRNIDCKQMLGMSYYETSQLAEAIEQLGVVQAARKKDVKVMEVLAQCYRTKKDTTALIPLLRDWVAAADQAPLRIELGSYLIARRALPEAVSVLGGAAKLQEGNPVPYRLLAQAYELQGDDKQRLRSLQSVVERAPRDPDAHFQVARYYLGKRDETKAQPSLESAVACGAAHAAARYELGKIYAKAGVADDAFRLFSEAAQLEPDNAMYQCELASSASLLGKVDQALAAADAALAKGGKNTRILYTAAAVYNRVGQSAKAKQLLNTALAANDTCRACHEALGDAHLAEGNYKLAVKSLMRAWELGGFSEPVVLKLGEALMTDEKYTEATDFLKLVLSKNPGADRAVYDMCHILCRQQNVAEALKLAESFGQKKSKTGWVHLALGEVAETRGETDAAWISFNVALRLLPDEPRVQAACGRIYVARGQYQTAAELFGQALAKDPNNPYLLVNLAEAYEGLNDIPAATDLCTSVIQRVPENPEPYYVLARITSQRKDHAAALKYINQGLAGNPANGKLLYVQGHELRATGQPAAAVAAYEAALKNGAPIEAYRHIGDVYFDDLKDPVKAKENYQNYVKAGGTNVEIKVRLKNM